MNHSSAELRVTVLNGGNEKKKTLNIYFYIICANQPQINTKKRGFAVTFFIV